MAENTVRKVDQAALRTNQASIIGLLIAAFVANAWPVVTFVAAVMLIGTVWPEAALFKWLYRRALRPAGLVKPDVIPDNPEPHQFAQGVGGVVLLLSTAAFLLGARVIGWAAAWLVIALAAANLFLGFCAGCFIYYQLNRLGVPGFTVAPLKHGNHDA
ncbi:MAG: DUF4395 domain-containing protein [Anaerolineae bacterium]|nr:DUF4395 domain-containing protein [Anaerolineae bacterium]